MFLAVCKAKSKEQKVRVRQVPEKVNREGGVNGKTIMFKVHDVGDDSVVSPVNTVRTLASNMTAGRPAVIFGLRINRRAFQARSEMPTSCQELARFPNP